MGGTAGLESGKTDWRSWTRYPTPQRAAGLANKNRAAVKDQPCFRAAMHDLLRTARSLLAVYCHARLHHQIESLQRTRTIVQERFQISGLHSVDSHMRTLLDIVTAQSKHFHQSGRWQWLPLGKTPHYSLKQRASSIWRRHAIVIHLAVTSIRATQQSASPAWVCAATRVHVCLCVLRVGSSDNARA